jgi:hypothetical protein
VFTRACFYNRILILSSQIRLGLTSSLFHSGSVAGQVPGHRRSPPFKYQGCDNVLPDQGYNIPRRHRGGGGRRCLAGETRRNSARNLVHHVPHMKPPGTEPEAMRLEAHALLLEPRHGLNCVIISPRQSALFPYTLDMCYSRELRSSYTSISLCHKQRGKYATMTTNHQKMAEDSLPLNSTNIKYFPDNRQFQIVNHNIHIVITWLQMWRHVPHNFLTYLNINTTIAHAYPSSVRHTTVMFIRSLTYTSH